LVVWDVIFRPNSNKWETKKGENTWARFNPTRKPQKGQKGHGGYSGWAIVGMVRPGSLRLNSTSFFTLFRESLINPYALLLSTKKLFKQNSKKLPKIIIKGLLNPLKISTVQIIF
jgi:hypothetical protein